MVRVCYLVDAPYAGGAERYVQLLIDALDRRRFEPSLIATSHANLDEWCDGIASSGVPVSRVSMRMPFRPADAAAIYRCLREHGPHIAHVNMPGPYDGQMGLLVPMARLAGADRVVATEHLPMVEFLWKRALVKRLAYTWVDEVFTVCHDNVPYLERRQRVVATRIRVVHNALPPLFGTVGFDRRRWRAERGVPSDGFVVAFVGSLIERKGLHVLLEALAGVSARAWRAIVVGTGPEAPRLKDLSQRLGLDARVSFEGACDSREIERVLLGADVLVVPSFMEAFPYVILEAMACSRPVIASRINGIPEAVADGTTGLLCEPGDPQALGAALLTLMEHDGRCERMGMLARRRFERLFTMEIHKLQMEDAYLRLLNGRAPGKQGLR